MTAALGKVIYWQKKKSQSETFSRRSQNFYLRAWNSELYETGTVWNLVIWLASYNTKTEASLCLNILWIWRMWIVLLKWCGDVKRPTETLSFFLKNFAVNVTLVCLKSKMTLKTRRQEIYFQMILYFNFEISTSKYFVCSNSIPRKEFHTILMRPI